MINDYVILKGAPIKKYLQLFDLRRPYFLLLLIVSRNAEKSVGITAKAALFLKKIFSKFELSDPENL